MSAAKKTTKKVAKKTTKKVAKKAAKKVTKKAVKKSATKKAVAKSSSKVPLTRILARVDVRYGNVLYIRGEGGGLSWNEGVPMENVSSDEWKWESAEADSGIVFKFLVNDEIWANGEDHTVAAGATSISTPSFY
ncbi:MAG: hypothetical protein AAGJ81_14925 [Verrucomicrobiota bacterium]